MKTSKKNVDNLNDMVFEKRNQEYGAFVLRANYNVNVIKSTLITAGSFMALVFILFAFSGGNVKMEDNIIVEDNKNGRILTKTQIDIPEPQPEQPKKPQPNAASLGSVIPVVNRNASDSAEQKSNEHLDGITGLSKDPEAKGTSPIDTGTKFTEGAIVVRDVKKVEKNDIKIWAEIMPKYDGDLAKDIQRMIEVPQEAIEVGVNGVVYVSFVVEPNGAVSNVKISRGVGFGCNEEAARVVAKMTKWIPGRMENENVRVMCNLPIRFKTQ